MRGLWFVAEHDYKEETVVHLAGVWHVCGFVDEDSGGLDIGSKGEVVARSM